MAGGRGLEDALFWLLIAATVLAGALSLWPKVAPSFAPARLVVSPYRAEKVSLNRATPAELEALPGIGPELARRIVENRPYLRKEDLLKVPGIGEKLYRRLEPLVEP